ADHAGKTMSWICRGFDLAAMEPIDGASSCRPALAAPRVVAPSDFSAGPLTDSTSRSSPKQLSLYAAARLRLTKARGVPAQRWSKFVVAVLAAEARRHPGCRRAGEECRGERKAQDHGTVPRLRGGGTRIGHHQNHALLCFRLSQPGHGGCHAHQLR